MASKLEVKQGRYGSSKVKAFSILSDGNWWPSLQLCIAAGIPYHSLARAFSRWVGFDYVTRRPIEFCGRYEYRLTAHGKQWLNLSRQYLPNHELFMQELTGWQRNLTDEALDELLSMPFKEFICNLDDMVKEFQKNYGRGIDNIQS